MISKETFVKVFDLIKEQERINEEFSEALNLVGNGHFAFGCENCYLEALLLVLKETMDDVYDYIDWWLYEASDDFRVENTFTGEEWNLKTPEDLYNFLVEDSPYTTSSTPRKEE